MGCVAVIIGRVIVVDRALLKLYLQEGGDFGIVSAVTMNDAPFTHDVFLSHSAKDKAVVRALAERLRADGLRVWFDEWEIKPGDSIPAKIEEGLDHSRVFVLCMSANASGSDWAHLEAGTCGRGNLPFRDPLNKDRRFIPLRLDEALIKASLAQFLYLNWLPEDREHESSNAGRCFIGTESRPRRLLLACQSPTCSAFPLVR